MDETAKLWDIRSSEIIQSREDHTDKIFGVAFHPEGTALATASRNNTVKLWDIEETATLLNTLTGHTSIVLNVAFSPDGNTLASVSNDHTIQLWSLNPARLAAWNCRWLDAFLAHTPGGQRAEKEGVCAGHRP